MSWYEADTKKKGTSWKENVCSDIEFCRSRKRSWEEYVRAMRALGYQVREGKYVTDILPNGKRVRDRTLGASYTKAALTASWSFASKLSAALAKSQADVPIESDLSTLVNLYPDELFLRVPLGPKGKQCAYSLLNPRSSVDKETLRSYVAPELRYEICNEVGECVYNASGAEIVQAMEELWEKRRRLEAGKVDEQRRYYNPHYRNRWKRNDDYCLAYDESGRRRTILELAFILAMTIMGEDVALRTDYPTLEEGDPYEPFFAKTDWKIQNAIDAMEIARQEGLRTPVQVDQQLNMVGAECSRAKSALKKVSAAKERMEPLATAVNTYKRTKKDAEAILSMPEGNEKTRIREQHAQLLHEYTQALHTMQHCYVRTERDLISFDLRYDKICRDVQTLEVKRK